MVQIAIRGILKREFLLFRREPQGNIIEPSPQRVSMFMKFGSAGGATRGFVVMKKSSTTDAAGL
jgi:hypothetical protein